MVTQHCDTVSTTRHCKTHDNNSLRRATISLNAQQHRHGVRRGVTIRRIALERVRRPRGGLVSQCPRRHELDVVLKDATVPGVIPLRLHEVGRGYTDDYIDGYTSAVTILITSTVTPTVTSCAISR